MQELQNLLRPTLCITGEHVGLGRSLGKLISSFLSGPLNKVSELRNRTRIQDSRCQCWSRIDGLLQILVIVDGMSKRSRRKLDSDDKAKKMVENKPSVTSNKFGFDHKSVNISVTGSAGLNGEEPE